jgi:RNA polymerase sigma-70 factor (ECF subfamily)
VDGDRALIERALGRHEPSIRTLVERLGPVIRARCAAVARRAPGRRFRSGAELETLVDDLAQEAFASLFQQEGRALRSWAPERGLSLESYAGLLAEHQAASILRSGRRSAWREDATADDALESKIGETPAAHARVHARELLERLLERVRATLTPKGLQLFELLFVEQRSVDEVRAATGLSADAVYAWRSRLSRTASEILEELEGTPSERLARQGRAP